jgi:hypothetical protein
LCCPCFLPFHPRPFNFPHPVVSKLPRVTHTGAVRRVSQRSLRLREDPCQGGGCASVRGVRVFPAVFPFVFAGPGTCTGRRPRRGVRGYRPRAPERDKAPGSEAGNGGTEWEAGGEEGGREGAHFVCPSSPVCSSLPFPFLAS